MSFYLGGWGYPDLIGSTYKNTPLTFLCAFPYTNRKSWFKPVDVSASLRPFVQVDCVLDVVRRVVLGRPVVRALNK